MLYIFDGNTGPYRGHALKRVATRGRKGSLYLPDAWQVKCTSNLPLYLTKWIMEQQPSCVMEKFPHSLGVQASQGAPFIVESHPYALAIPNLVTTLVRNAGMKTN